jgi:hypothetical protein
MKPTTKTFLIVVSCFAGIFIVPGILVLLHNYISAIIFASATIACFALVGYYAYQDLLRVIRQHEIEEEQMLHRFHGNKELLARYKAFRRYFDGDINLKELGNWIEKHSIFNSKN